MPSSTPFTEAECFRWKHEKTRNPRTNRIIDPKAVKGVYQELMKQCLGKTKVVNAVKAVKTAKAVKSQRRRSLDATPLVLTRTETKQRKRQSSPRAKAVTKSKKPIQRKASKPKSPKPQVVKAQDTRTVAQRYCDCVMHVRVKNATGAYPICTKSVLHKYNAKRPAACDYDWDKYTTEEILAYADELSTRKGNPLKITAKARTSRSTLIKEITQHFSKRK